MIATTESTKILLNPPFDTAEDIHKMYFYNFYLIILCFDFAQ
jgi:hypothetical protein